MTSLESKRTGYHRLSGWQAIADYFQRSPSTVRRWAAEHDLPIYRPSGTVGKRGAAVFAYSDELDDWLRGAISKAEVSGSVSSTPRRVPQVWRWGGVAGAVLGLALAGLLLWNSDIGQSRQTATPSQTQIYAPIEVNRGLYSDALYLVEKRTPASLSQAMDLLDQLTRNDPDDGAAWSLLATAFNLMVEYGLVDPETGYGRSHAAAERALVLDPSLARAQTVLADIDFFWFRATGEGLARFEQALALDPSDAQTLHWYASALAFSGEPGRALIEIRKAKYADPGSRAIRVSEAIILLSAGQVEAAGAVLEELIRHEPAYRNPYRFLAFVQLAREDYGGYLDAWNERFALTDDPAGAQIVAAGRAGLATGDRDGMIAAMVAAKASSGDQQALEPYFLAHLNALSGDIQETVTALERVETRQAYYYSIDPAFFPLRQQAAFREAVQAMKMPAI